ncbi:hypothetical protein GCM10022198_22660 [Klugiella xanthotipulae]|uniref:Integral membrane protein n=1 Tax=Klugiella xanthotipulae TaxID=244735 RepID=A0A543HYL0_9MICO|nr:hypothetical protein [Klugiella xanthotipulae]TQM63335.1 hypothetical protein FB466_1595 [Klugiella xanthotipulae]
MTPTSNDTLAQRLAELEAANATLTARLSRVRTGTDAPDTTNRRSWGWTLLATALLVLGALLAPVALAASWAKTELTDTEKFVATYAPLAQSTAVQDFITDQAVTVVTENVDIPQLTSDVVDGITDLGTGPAATRALSALKGPAAQGITALVRSTVDRFVTSDAFAQAWTQALRVSHTQLVAAMRNDADAAVSLGSDGSIGLQLGPIIAEVKTALVVQGLTFAENIPEVNRTVTIAQSDAVPTAQLGYGLTIAAGSWLPGVVLLLLTLGVIVARRRTVAIVWAAIGLALSMALLTTALGVARIAAITAISPSQLPSEVSTILFDTVVDPLRESAVAVLVLAAVVALVAWYAGPFSRPRRLRGLVTSGIGWVRTSADRHGISTGQWGTRLFAQRTLLRAVVAAVAATIILLVRPLTAGLVGWTLLLSVFAILGLELLQRPQDEGAGGSEPRRTAAG